MDKTNICSQAILSNQGDMTSFRFGNQNIGFRSPKCLKHYVDIKEWDNGYLVVIADYEGLGLTEEYIDLVPIIESLQIEPQAFLSQIKSVKIGEYDYE